jgi:hypothetical protein
MSIKTDTQNLSPSIQPALDRAPDGDRACSAADVVRTLHQFHRRPRVSSTPFCLITSAPVGAASHLLNCRLRDLLFKHSGHASGVALIVLSKSPRSSKSLAAAIYESLTWAPAPSITESEIWNWVRAEISRNATSCIMISQFEKAIVGQTTRSRRQIFQRLLSLMMPHGDAPPVNLVLTGGPQLTKALSKEVELLRRAIIMPVNTADETISYIKADMQPRMNGVD